LTATLSASAAGIEHIDLAFERTAGFVEALQTVL